MPQEPSALDGPEPGFEAATPASPAPPSEPSRARATPPATSLRSRAGLTTYATAVQGLARFLYSLLIGHLGSRELLGQTNTSLSLSVFTSQLWAAPASVAGMRFVALRAALSDPVGAATVARHIAVRTAVISLVLPTGVALAGSLWLGFDAAQTLSTALLAFAYSMYSTTRGIQYGHLRYRRVAVWDTIAGATSLLAVVVVLALDLTPSPCCRSLWATACSPSSRGRRAAVAGWSPPCAARSTASCSSAPSAARPAGACSSSRRSPPTPPQGPARPVTTRQRSTLATPASMLSIALSTVLIPPLVAAAGRGDRRGVHVQSDVIARRLTAIFVGLFGVLTIVSPLAIAVIWGEAYSGAAEVLPILLIAVMLASIALGGATTLQSTRARGPRAVAFVNLAGFAVSLLAWPFLAPSLGTTGVALGYLLGSGTASLATLGTVWWIERHHWRAWPPGSSAAPPSSSPSPC